MLKKTLFLIGVFVALTNSVWAHEPFQTSSPKGILRDNSGMPVGPSPFTTWQRMLTRFDVEYLYGDDNRLYCTLENDPMINGVEAPQANDLKEKSTQKKRPEQNWGIAAGLRVARIPFDTKGDTVTNFVPLFYYEDDLFFLRGLEGGIKITGTNVCQLNALGRLRFFDIPKKFQNEIQEDTVDLGFQLRYLPGAHTFVEFELLSDPHFRLHSNVRTGLDLEHGAFEWTPYVNFNFKHRFSQLVKST